MNLIYKSLLIITIASLLQACAGAFVAGGTAVSAAHDRRSLGSFVEDQNIELKAYDMLSNNTEIDKNTNISVTSYNGIVLLSGQTPTPELRNLAEQLVRQVPQIRRIHNELSIAAPSSIGTRSNDTWVTTKIKTNLFKVKNHDNFDPTRVKVVTEQGIVYLMGLLNQQEADDVVNVIRTIKGVQKVVKMFEYIK